MSWLVDLNEPRAMVNRFSDESATRLDVGDYALEPLGSLGIERKSSDFINFSDVVHKIDEMRLFYEKPVLLVEGSLSKHMKALSSVYHKPMYNQMIGMLSHLIVVDVPPVFLPNQQILYDVMMSLGNKYSDNKDRSPRWRDTKTRPSKKLLVPLKVLLGFGIGREKSIRLLNHYGNLTKIFLSNPTDMEKIEGIGFETMIKVFRGLAEEWKQ